MPQINMERYIVNVAPPGTEAARLVVPISPTSHVSDLAKEVKKRATRNNIWPNVPELVLHLGEADGPIIDYADILSDVILDPKAEVITATPQIQRQNSTPGAQVSGFNFRRERNSYLINFSRVSRLPACQLSPVVNPSNSE